MKLDSTKSAEDAVREAMESPAAVAAGSSELGGPRVPAFKGNQVWSYFGPAFVASVAYIDPGNFATNILGGAQFGYRLLWVLLWSNAMAILIQYLSAKLGIVTGRTLPQNCRTHFAKPTTIFLWVCAEISAVATDMAEFLGAAMGLDLLAGPALQAHGMSPMGSLFCCALVATVAVFAILALDLAGYQWLERGIMGFVGIIGLCYGFEVFLVHPAWVHAFYATIVPTFDTQSSKTLSLSVYAAVGMLGATVMPHVIYLHSALVQPRLMDLGEPQRAPQKVGMVRQYLRYELVDVFVAMNGAWLINSAMIIMAAVALFQGAGREPDDSGCVSYAGAAVGQGRGRGVCGGAVVLGVVELDGGRDGRAGDY